MDSEKSRLFALISSKALQELHDVTNGTTDSVIMTNEAILGLKQTIVELQNENNLLYSENELLKQQNSYEQEKTVNQSQGDVSFYENQLKELENRCSLYQQQIYQLQSSNKEDESDKYREIIEQLESEISMLKSQSESNQAAYLSKESELENTIHTLREQTEVYKSQIQELQQGNDTSDALTAMIEDSTKQKQQIYALEHKAEDLMRENEELQQKLEECEDSFELKKQINSLMVQNDEYAQNNAECQSEIMTLKKSMDMLENAKALEQKKGLEFEFQIANLKKEVEGYKRQLSALQEQKMSEEEEHSRAAENTEGIEELVLCREKLEKEIDELKEKNNTLTQMKEMLSEAIDKQRGEYEEQLKEKIQEVSERNITIEMKDSQLRKLKTQIDELNSYALSLEKQLTGKGAQNEELTKRAAEIEQDFDALTQKNIQLNKDFSDFKSSICSLLCVTNSNDAITKLNENLNKMVELIQLSESSVILKAELENEKQKYSFLETKYKTIEEQLTHERQKSNAVARGQTNGAVKTMQIENSKLLQERKFTENQLDTLREQLINQEAENQRLRLEVDKASRKQQLATNRSERLSLFEFSHNEAVRFAQTLSDEINQKLDPSTTNMRRIKIIDNLAKKLESQYASEEQIAQVWDSFRNLLLSDFMCPDIDSIKSIIESRVQQTFAIIDEKFDDMNQKLQSASCDVDMIYRNHRMSTPKRKTRTFNPETPLSTAKQTFSFIKTPDYSSTPTRVAVQRKNRTPNFFNRNRPNLTPRDNRGNPPSARRPFY